MEDGVRSGQRVAGLGLGAGLSALGVGVSWVCCLPLALGGLSASTAAFGLALTPWRPPLTALSLALLAAAFWFTHRPPGSAPSCDRRRRPRWLWLVAVLSITLLTLQHWASWVIYWSL